MTQPKYSYKPDWERAQKRWDAYWGMEVTDRPCMSILAARTDGRKIQLPEIRSEGKWMDPDYLVAKAVKYFEETHLGGEAVPRSIHFMAGTATGCDGHLHFGDGGISIRPSMTTMDQPLDWHPGPQDPWRPKVEAICNRLLDEAKGRFIVSPPGQFENIDLLNMLRGNEETMLDMAMYPEQSKARLREMRDLSEENNNHFRSLIEKRQGDVGYVSWTGLWSRQIFRCAQADAAACISPEMFEEFVLPELDVIGERYGQIHYHTCGYKQHLELCLSRSYMKVIQYSPSCKEPKNGPDHLEFYRRVQATGRCLDVDVPLEHVEFLIRHLRPEGLHIGTWVNSLAEAEELLDNAVKLCGRDIHSSV